MTKICVKDDVEIKVGEHTKKISIYRNGDKPNYYYYFRHNGVKYQGSCKSSVLKTSKQNVREICYDLIKGVRQKGQRKPITLEKIIKDFLESKRLDNLSPKTLTEYTRQSNFILQWYNETSKGMGINVFFKTERYDQYCEWRRSFYENHNNTQIYEINGEPVEGRTYYKVGNPSLNRECLLMGSILKYGKKSKHILKGVQIPSYKVKKERSQLKQKEILDLEDYNNLKKYWMKKDPFIWDCFGTIHHLGLRPSELGKILYENVHLKEGYVEILNRKNKSKGDPINSSVPLVKSSKEIFERLMKRSGVDKGKTDPVFIREGMKKPYTSPYLNKLFKQSVKKVTKNEEYPDGRDLTLHSLRHLFITRYMKKRINLKLLSGVVGHKDTTMLSRYSHLMWEDFVEVFQKLDKEREEEIKQENKLKKNTNTEPDVPLSPRE